MRDVACTAEVITPRGRGAVATIRFCGDCGRLDGEELFRAANGQPVPRQPIDRIVFGLWGRTASEQVVLCRTAGNVVEIHCHGGEAAVRRILADLAAAGCETRAWEPAATAETDLLGTECEAALIGAATLQTAAIALDQQSGALVAAFEELRLVDFDEPSRNEAAARIAGLLQWAGVGLHLTQPWNVVLAGRPNVGKSSLINALVGYARAVVHDRPGTTRDVVTAETALAGWPVQFADTAGIRHEAEPIEAAGIGMARQRFAAADCRILVIDRSEPPHDDDRQLLSDWPAAIVVANKCDLPDAWGDAVPGGALIVSAQAHIGINELAAAIIERLVPDTPPPGTPVPVSSRQVDWLETALSALEENDRSAYQRAIDALLA